MKKLGLLHVFVNCRNRLTMFVSSESTPMSHSLLPESHIAIVNEQTLLERWKMDLKNI